MKRKCLIPLAILAAAIIIAAIIASAPKPLPKDISDEITALGNTPSSPGDYAAPDPLTDANTILYENKELGFSIRYPKALVSKYEDGTIVSSRTISVFPDPKDGEAFIVTPVGDEKPVSSLKEILAMTGEQRASLDMWEIHFTDMRAGESKVDLANRIFNFPDFKYAKLENSEMAGNNPSVYYGGGEGFVAIKESPSGKRAAVWSLGGDTRFGTYDYYMIDSFKVFDK